MKITGISNNSLPTHIGIIMDGNRRWAKKKFLPSLYGHSRGAEVFKSIAIYCNKIGIKYLTVYAFSTENWKRSKYEVSYLMNLFKKYLSDTMLEKFGFENIKIKFIGDISKFSDEMISMIKEIETKSNKNNGMVLNIAINYGGREELTHATKLISQEIKNNKLNIENISEEYLSSKLYNSGQPDIDLIIRTADEQRISNFMLWQSAYAEFYFTSTLWPDFNENELNKAINEYSTRVRRFGGA